MSRLIKWYALAAILALISLSIYAAGGGNDNAAPFPVPLSCYSEIAGSPNFLEDGCDPQLLFDFKTWLYEYIETETNQFWLQWNEGDLLALDIFSLMHAVEGGFNKNERLL